MSAPVTGWMPVTEATHLLQHSQRAQEALSETIQGKALVILYRGEGIYFDRQQLADQCRLPRNRVHAVEGSSYEGIAQVAAQIRAGVVAVGSAPRPASGSILGATAERVIDEVPGDMVVLPAEQTPSR